MADQRKTGSGAMKGRRMRRANQKKRAERIASMIFFGDPTYICELRDESYTQTYAAAVRAIAAEL